MNTGPFKPLPVALLDDLLAEEAIPADTVDALVAKSDDGTVMICFQPNGVTVMCYNTDSVSTGVHVFFSERS